MEQPRQHCMLIQCRLSNQLDTDPPDRSLLAVIREFCVDVRQLPNDRCSSESLEWPSVHEYERDDVKNSLICAHPDQNIE